MVRREEMLELVEAHRRIDEPMATAIWIHQTAPEAWLVEVLPELGPDPFAERPVAFSPGRFFRHPLHLVAGNLADIEAAIVRDSNLAEAIASGEVLHGEATGEQLKTLAARVHDGRSRAG